MPRARAAKSPCYKVFMNQTPIFFLTVVQSTSSKVISKIRVQDLLPSSKSNLLSSWTSRSNLRPYRITQSATFFDLKGCNFRAYLIVLNQRCNLWLFRLQVWFNSRFGTWLKSFWKQPSLSSSSSSSPSPFSFSFFFGSPLNTEVKLGKHKRLYLGRNFYFSFPSSSPPLFASLKLYNIFLKW